MSAKLRWFMTILDGAQVLSQSSPPLLTTEYVGAYGRDGHAGARFAACRQDGCCRIEFEHDGQWGTVCDDYWTDANTAVACRTAGCSAQGATAISYAWDMAFDWDDVATGMIWLDDVQCTGSEARIGDCDHSGWGQHDCTHDEDVGVCCQGVVCPAVSCTLLSLLLKFPDFLYVAI
jgi:hypothetical protein